MSFLAGLGCVGLCLAQLGSYSFAGGRGSFEECCGLEDGSFVSDAVYLEGT
jgi:hypothetical protein